MHLKNTSDSVGAGTSGAIPALDSTLPAAPDSRPGSRSYKTYDTLIVNDYLTLRGIPPQTFDYRLGNRSALEWIVDRYQVKTDERSGIVSDPNNPDDERYIVCLVTQIITVSLETVNLINALPPAFR